MLTFLIVLHGPMIILSSFWAPSLRYVALERQTSSVLEFICTDKARLFPRSCTQTMSSSMIPNKFMTVCGMRTVESSTLMSYNTLQLY
jgi:hypothetical protein